MILASAGSDAPKAASAWDWLEWPIWDFVGTVATVLGLIAIFLAVGELRQRRKRISSTYLEIGSPGHGGMEDGTEYHMVSITNGGWAQINLLTIGVAGGRVLSVPGRDAPIRWHLPPGESATFAITAADYDKVWFLICSLSVLDRTKVRWSWEPFTDSSPLVAEQGAQIQHLMRWYKLRKALSFTRGAQLRAARGVGPGEGCTYVVHVPNADPDKRETATDRVTGPFFATRGTLLSNRIRTDSGAGTGEN